MGLIEEIVGAILGVFILVDIFLLVLYARAENEFFSKYLAEGVWRVFVRVSKYLGRWQNFFLSLTGPIVVVIVFITWFVLLSLAAALIVHPNLGTGIKAEQGPTSTDFVTALYVGGSSLSLVGVSHYEPQDAVFRFFFLLTSLIGVSIVSLSVTYLLELYNNLRQRNVVALRIQLLSSETGDAAEVIAGLGPRGDFEDCYDVLAQWGFDLVADKEAHQFFPILFFFRFKQPYYSVSRASLVSLDMVTLIKSALDDEEYGWLKESAVTEQLGRAAFTELKALVENLIPHADVEAPPDAKTCELWKRRYAAAVERLKRAGIKTSKAGEEEYVRMRADWDGYITKLAPLYAYDLNEVDTALAKVK